MARPKREVALQGRKYYLSDEAIALLVNHCKGTPLTMSAYLDQLIKDQLGLHEVRRVVDEGQRQIAELTDHVKGYNLYGKEENKATVTKQPTKKDFKVDL